MSKDKSKSRDKRNLNLANLPLTKWRNLNSNEIFLPVGYVKRISDECPTYLFIFRPHYICHVVEV